MAMDGPSGMGTDGNVTCHLFTCVMVKSTNGDVMGTKSDTRPMHNLPTVATTARIHPSSTVEIREILVGGFSSNPMAAASHPTPCAHECFGSQPPLTKLQHAVTKQTVSANGCRMTDQRQHAQDALLIAARSGAHEFAALYRHFERPMLGFFVNATGRGDLAVDLTAETFARALESVAAFDPARGRADQWLFGIARHVLAESYRRRRVEASARTRLSMPS